MRNTALNSGMGVTRWINASASVEPIPIPQLTAAEQFPFILLMDRILSTKTVGPDTETGKLEAEIDRMVYELYGLSKKEIAAVEGKS